MAANVPIITVDWSTVRSLDAFYDVFLRQLGAPPWHGRNLNALFDSIGVGSINQVEPPYTIIFKNVQLIPDDLADFARGVMHVCVDAAVERAGVSVRIDGASPSLSQSL